MRSASRVLVVPLVAALLAGASGCQDVPDSASKKDFCSAGEKFSESTTFQQGVSSAKKLSETGTPSDIPERARAGFVQLVDRVLDAENGQDFIKKSKALSRSERKNLKALDAYIKSTCTH